jgi:hypothetical protein
MRAFVLFLFCSALALQGPVQARVAKTPCPMEQTEHAVAMDVDATMDMQDDCCNDAETIAKTGKLCKTGQDCQPSNPGALVSPAPSAVPQPDTQPVPLVERFTPPDTPASVWRPPALT